MALHVDEATLKSRKPHHSRGRHLTYRVVDVTENQAALEYVTEDLKYSSAPVVVVDDQNHWAGFRPDLLGTLPVQA